MANMFSIRHGDIDDRDGEIIDDACGWGVGMRLGDLGGFRVDRATVPQAKGLAHVHKRGYLVYFGVSLQTSGGRKLTPERDDVRR